MFRKFPNDVTGDVLRKLQESGDPLTEPRRINFHFLFPTRSEAIGFIEILPGKDLRHELAWYVVSDFW